MQGLFLTSLSERFRIIFDFISALSSFLSVFFTTMVNWCLSVQDDVKQNGYIDADVGGNRRSHLEL